MGRLMIRRVLGVMLIAMLLFIPITTEKSLAASSPTVKYKVHVQNKGWLGYKRDGQMAGTTGKSLRMEALNISSSKVKVTYRAHVAGIGWQSWRKNGQMAGTTGRGKAIEAVQIKLTGKSAKKYDIYYSVHVAHRGWLGWAKNGAVAGSTGMCLRTEAIRIKVVKKGTRVNTGSRASLKKPGLVYRANSQGNGWMKIASEGAVAGTTGKAKRLEALAISFRNFDGKNGITYRAHVANIGWQSWRSTGTVAGTTGKNYAIEAMQIKLAGGMDAYFDVYYRMHVANYGWLGWAKNGEVAGTTGGGVRGEAIQIRIVPKGSAFSRGGSAYIDLSAQYAKWFMNAVYITQLPGVGTHQGTQNFDVIGYNGDHNIFAPFDCRVAAIYTGYKSGNTVVIESLRPVRYANGTVDYMSMCFGHDDDISNLHVGQTIRQGAVFYQTGTYGYADGRHSHVTCIRGKYAWDMWTANAYGNCCSPKAISPVDALYVPASTRIVQTLGLPFKRL